MEEEGRRYREKVPDFNVKLSNVKKLYQDR